MGEDSKFTVLQGGKQLPEKSVTIPWYDAYDFDHCPTRNYKNGPYYETDIVAAIYSARGNFSEMAKLLGRNRSKIRDHIYQNKHLLEIWEETREGFIDRAERKLEELVEIGDGPSVRFVLLTLGKERGYVTRQETTGKNGVPLPGAVIYLPDNKRDKGGEEEQEVKQLQLPEQI